MREISPAVNISPDRFLIAAPPAVRRFVLLIREQKKAGTRRRPSATLIDRSALLTREQRARLLDQVAALVDQNLVGRSEMCLQSAELLQRSLAHLGLPAQAPIGTAIYYSGKREVFRWRHAWVRVGAEVIDGNVDVLDENPTVPSSVNIAPYWGPIVETPADRKLQRDIGKSLQPDDDVCKIWWPELCAWLDTALANGALQRSHVEH